MDILTIFVIQFLYFSSVQMISGEIDLEIIWKIKIISDLKALRLLL